MANPKLPIDVNEETGVWESDGLPMLYMPRHFFNNLHLGMEDIVGREAYRDNLYQSGYKSAYFWCQETAKTYGLEPIPCFEFYLERLSQRGWGLLAFKDQNLAQGSATIELRHSSFVKHKVAFDQSASNTCCYLFEGWFVGASDWVSDTLGWSLKYQCHEHQCAAVAKTENCLFKVEVLS